MVEKVEKVVEKEVEARALSLRRERKRREW